MTAPLVGLVEGVTSVAGDELTELAGYRLTRVTAQTSPENKVQTGTANASSADGGTTVTFPNGTLSADVVNGLRFRLLSDALDNVVDSDSGTARSNDKGLTVFLVSGSFTGAVPGRRFRLTSGIASGKSARIKRLRSDGFLELDEPGIGENFPGSDWEIVTDLTNESAKVTNVVLGVGNNITLEWPLGQDFTDQTWEVVQDAATSIPVETTLNWEDEGEIFADATQYRYDSKTLTSFDVVRPSLHHGERGRFRVVAGSALVDGESFVVDDGFGRVVKFEYELGDEEYDVQSVIVHVTAAMTATQVRDATLAAINDLSSLEIIAYAGPDVDLVDLRHLIPGGIGRIDVTDAVADAGFVTEGPVGVPVQIPVLASVVDYSRKYSAYDKYRNSFTVDGAEGEDLTVLGGNLGVLRPPPLEDDERFRRLIKALAFGPRGTMYAIEQVLDALLGVGTWEVFEDLTISPVNHTCSVYVRRKDLHELKSAGKTFLDGAEAVPVTDATHVSTTQTPIRASSVTLIDEPGGRFLTEIESGDPGTRKDRGYETYGRTVARGVGASSADGGVTVTLASGSFGAEILAGDLFIAETGPKKIGVVVTPGASLTLTDNATAVEGAPWLFIGENFASVRWRVVRPLTNARWYKPSGDTSLLTAGGTPVAYWSVVLAGTANEGTDVTLINDATVGRYTQIVDSAAANTLHYAHNARVRPESHAELEILLSVAGTISTTSGDERQVMASIRDGQRELAWGVRGVAATTLVRIGLIDTDPGAGGSRFLSSSFFTFDAATHPFASVRLIKKGEEAVELWVNGLFIDRQPYGSFYTSSVAEFIFGVLETNLAAAELHVKTVDAHAVTHTDYWNVHDTGDTAPSARLNSDGSVFLSSDVGKDVFITSVSTPQAFAGNARGRWTVGAFVSASAVDLIGPKQTGMKTNANFPKRAYATNPDAFTFPDHLGHSVTIESGPNIGTYQIAKILDPITFEDIALRYPDQLGALPLETPLEHSHVVELATALPNAESTEVADWHLVPAFPTDATVEFELGDAGTSAGAVHTLRQALPATVAAGEPVAVDFSTVRSAVTERSEEFEIDHDVNTATSVDGKVITFSGAPFSAGSPVHVGHTFRVFDANDAIFGKGRIETIDTASQITLEDDGIGVAFTNLRWEIVSGPDNVEYADEEYLFYPFYLFDDFGIIRDLVDLVTAAGVIPDFDSLQRDVENYPNEEVEGLHIVEE